MSDDTLAHLECQGEATETDVVGGVAELVYLLEPPIDPCEPSAHLGPDLGSERLDLGPQFGSKPLLELAPESGAQLRQPLPDFGVEAGEVELVELAELCPGGEVRLG